MENLGKKVGFLKGLMEGMSFDTDSANGKLMAGIVGLLGDLSDRVEAIDELLEDLNDYVESIDEDLTELEGARDDMDELFDDEDDDEDFDDMMFDNSEDKLHLLRPARGEEPEPAPEEDSVAGNRCPECNATFYTALNDPADAQYICPNCQKKVRPVRMGPEDAVIVKPVEEEKAP